jgi:hypothetical protein
MKKTTWTGLCIAIVGFSTAAIIAQTTPPPQSNPSSAGKQITVTGCLKAAPGAAPTAAGTAGTPGTAGTTGTASAAGAATETAADMKFLLTNVAPSSGDASGGASTAGAAPAASAASTAPSQTYRLIANAASLSPHVGKKLELTGTVEDQDSGARASGSAVSEANAPALRVSSGKVIAASCSE